MSNPIYNGNAWDYIKQMRDNSVDLILTDPLYDDTLNMQELERVSKGHIIAFCAPENRFFEPDETAYWIKQPSTKNYGKRLGRFVELILIKRQGNTFNPGLHWSNYTGVYDDRLLTKQNHPYEKPISLLERLISIYSKPGDLVFDPFFGSGSTLTAAYNLGRRCVGCEIEPKYFDYFLGSTKVPVTYVKLTL